jgi:hypothetical protein
MSTAVFPSNKPKPGERGEVIAYAKTMRYLRLLIWLYLILLIVEGSLRKWVVPQLSNPLLIIRDPVVICIYILALRVRLFPKNGFVISLGIIAILSFVVSVFVLFPYIPMNAVFEVTLYGFRSDFLHLPLIFVIANVLNEEDVKHVGKWTLLCMLPMAALMVAQFQAPIDAFINRAVGLGENLQIQAGGGKIRPPGPFSFISGPIFYVSVSTAFLIYGALSRGAYKTWVLVASGFATVIAAAVSGSRGCVASALVVVLFIFVVLLVRPSAVNRLGWIVLSAVLAGVIISRLPIFKEGANILSERFTTSAEAGDTTIVGGMLGRTLSEFTDAFDIFDKAPLFGYGLGIGTSGGAKFLIGQSTFLLTEGEWSRILLESGPILGLAFLIWRTVFTGWIFYLSLKQVRLGRTLPIFLFASGFLGFLTGTLGQPTSLGFTVVIAGLCLAAIQNPTAPVETSTPAIASSQRPQVPRRSVYASRLYGPDAEPEHSNGSVDR